MLLQEARTELKKAKRVDLYKILDVAPTASQEDIKKAYKRMALKLREHPSPRCLYWRQSVARPWKAE